MTKLHTKLVFNVVHTFDHIIRVPYNGQIQRTVVRSTTESCFSVFDAMCTLNIMLVFDVVDNFDHIVGVRWNRQIGHDVGVRRSA